MNLRFITGNKGKVAEMQELLAPLGITVIQDNLGYPEVQADTLQEVAALGAQHLLRHGTEPPFILEDAGMFIPSLDGFPGVYSSYVHQTIGTTGITRLVPPGTPAYFAANLCYVDASGMIHHFEGRCQGTIQAAAGDGGFGYDPIFAPVGYAETFGQLPREVKGKLSHRGAAAQKFLAHLQAA